MVVINLDVVKGADPANNAVCHRDGAHLQTAAELHIRLDAPQQEHIGGKPADIHHKGTGILLDDLGLGNHGGIGLGIDQHLADHQADGAIIKFELHCPSLEILRKTIPQFIVLRGQADGQYRNQSQHRQHQAYHLTLPV